jgi:thiol-disulfide isomerase/thioredoxin
VKNLTVQLAFIVAAAAVVFGFMQAARRDQRRADCSALCAMAPGYAGRNLKAPDFELSDLTGKKVKLSDYRGKTVILNFWASWCDPCRKEMPSFADLSKVLSRRKDIVLLTVTVDESLDVAKEALQVLLETSEPPFPVLHDPEMKIVRDKYGTKLYPETWIIDPEGYIRARFDGEKDWKSALAVEVAEVVSKRGPGCLVDVRKGKTTGPFAGLCEAE